MTIEPSLLSQVCSLIEKERLHEGKEKISAEFLDKYSKAFILRSIYDEAMRESNGAMIQPANGLLVAAKPGERVCRRQINYRRRLPHKTQHKPKRGKIIAGHLPF